MGDWNEGIAHAVTYIEDNLTQDINMDKIAEKAYVSSFYFQKIFNCLCGFTVGEYIRNRRLTLAAQELCSTDIKVIDVAMKYGYDSPDSFARAFTKFHGVSPSKAKEQGLSLLEHGQFSLVVEHCQNPCRMLILKSGANGCRPAKHTSYQATTTLRCMGLLVKIQMTITAKFGFHWKKFNTNKNRA